MSSATEFLQAGQEGFGKKSSSGVEKFITDDFVMTTPVMPRSRQEFLDWVAAGGSPTSISDIEVIYENDEVAVVQHSANNSNGDGTAMALNTKKGGKFSEARVMRTAVNRNG